MTQGFLLFAHNNEEISYSLMAAWQAKRISKWLSKPVSLVTDLVSLEELKKNNLDSVFDKIITNDLLVSQKKQYNGNDAKPILNFNNFDRSLCWDLTPYEETIVMDTDIIIQSSRLNTLWNSQDDILVCKKSTNLFGRQFQGLEYLSNYGIRFYWATLFYFKKNQYSKTFFETCQKIKDQYSWYAFTYEVPSTLMRNDYIWSIAINQLGSNYVGTIPFDLLYILDRDYLIAQNDEAGVVFSDNQICKVSNIDLHVMNKFDLMRVVKEELNV